MADSDGMSKVQITLILGIACWIVWCIPFINSMLYMLCFAGTMVMGFLAHGEARETGEDTTMAKVGMVLAVLPAILFVLAFFAMMCGMGGLIVLDSM